MIGSMGNRISEIVIPVIQLVLALVAFVWFLRWTPRSLRELRKHRLSLLAPEKRAETDKPVKRAPGPP